MTDERDRRRWAENLISQDSNINDASMKEFRMQLEQSLNDWQRRQDRLWRILLIAGAAYLLEIIFAMAYLNGLPADSQKYVFLPFMVISWLTFIVLAYSAALYIGRYMPTIRRLRYDIQAASIAELREQIGELREEVRNRQAPER